MTGNVLGIGTKYYGKGDFLSNGSFVTTKWLILFYLPMLPLGSFRLINAGNQANFWFYGPEGYPIEKVPLRWRQVIDIYTSTMFMLGAIFCLVQMWISSNSTYGIKSERTGHNDLPIAPVSPSIQPTPSKLKPITYGPQTSSRASGYLPRSSPSFIRPQKADNGQPFPSKSGYIAGYPRELDNGSSSLTIDNSASGNPDLFVKLFTPDSSPPKAVRFFFVRAGDKFTIDNLTAGKFDIRYLNLDTGERVRTESLDILADHGYTVYLRKSTNGNLPVHPLNSDDF
jgi:hypothetical protein